MPDIEAIRRRLREMLKYRACDNETYTDDLASLLAEVDRLTAETQRNRVEITGRKGERVDLINLIEQLTAKNAELRGIVTDLAKSITTVEEEDGDVWCLFCHRAEHKESCLWSRAKKAAEGSTE